jgi:hypothetical protein
MTGIIGGAARTLAIACTKHVGVFRRSTSGGAFTLALVLSCGTAWGGALTCLTGTDPSVVGDLAQIVVVRSSVDSACMCAGFDGSPGKTHGDYVKCAKATIAAQASAGILRKQCKGAVTKYYSNATCGIPASQNEQPCVRKTLSNGKVSCAIKPIAIRGFPDFGPAMAPRQFSIKITTPSPPTPRCLQSYGALRR